MEATFKTLSVIGLLSIVVGACQTMITPILLPEVSPPTSSTVSTPSQPNLGCPKKIIVQDMIGWWTYKSNYVGTIKKNSGRLLFKADMSFEDPDTLFESRFNSDTTVARKYFLKGDTLLVYVTDRLGAGRGIWLNRDVSDCNKLKFAEGKLNTYKTELTR